MNDGTRKRATRVPLISPQMRPTPTPPTTAGTNMSGLPCTIFAAHDPGQGHDAADRQVDAPGQDDERLPDGQQRQDGGQLEDRLAVRHGGEARAEHGEHEDDEDEHDGHGLGRQGGPDPRHV